MSVSIGCGPLPSFVYDRYLHEPLMEGVYQAQYVMIKVGNLSKEDFSIQILRNIGSHTVQTAFLLAPAVNVIAFRVFLALRVTIKQSFERALIKGDQDQVRNYLELGMDPNAKNLAGVPLLFQSLDPEVIRMLIKGKADPEATDRNGGTFLEHLLLNGKVELAEELASENLFEVRPYLKDVFFDKIKENQACRTFLLHWGYDAPIESRSQYTYDLKTELPLEEAIMTGNVAYLKKRVNSLGTFKEVGKLKETLPHLRVEWIWGCFLQGYLENSGNNETVIREILIAERTAQTVKISGKDLLMHLFSKELVLFARRLCEEAIIDPKPYYSQEIFRGVTLAEKTFLLQIGYPATVEERCGVSNSCINNSLEKLIMTGQIALLEGVLTELGLPDLDNGLVELKQEFPLLNTDWIWEHILAGYCRNKAPDKINDKWVIQLLNRGGKIEALNEIKFTGKGELLQRVIASKKQGLAKSLVDGRFLKVDPFFKDSFLNPCGNRVTDVSRDFVRFLVTMGYEKIIKDRLSNNDQEKTFNHLIEKAIITCDEEALVQALEQNSMKIVIQYYRELKKEFPRLKPLWAWEHLAEFCFDKEKYEDFLALVNQDFYQPTDAFYDARKNSRSKTLTLKGDKALMKAGYRHGPLLKKHPGEELLEFKIIAYCHDVEGLQRLAREHEFQVIYDRLKELKSESPKMDTRWFWNALFTIPSTHFEQYRGIQEDLEIPLLSESYDMKTLKGFFNKINFLEISEADRTDTLGDVKIVRSQKELEEGVDRIVKGIKNSSNMYAISGEAKAIYVRQLNWILYYLEKDLGENRCLSKSAGKILVEMLKDCLVCHSRWNDVFDVTRKRLGDIEISFNGFEQQLQASLGQARGNIIERLTAANYSDTHVRDNLIYFLRDSRALPHQPVYGRLVVDNVTYNTPKDAYDAFGREYTPGYIIEVLYELLGENKDFYDLMFDTLGTRIAPQWHGQNVELRRKAQEVGLDETLTIEALKYMGLTASREPYSEKEFFKFLQGYGVTPTDSFEKVKKEYIAEKQAELDNAAQDRIKELETDLWSVSGGLETLLALPEHFKCTTTSLSAFYQTHPEIPEDVRSKVPSGEIKKQLIYIAHQMMYEMAPLPVRHYLALEEKGVFNEIAIPMEEYEVVLKGDIHPLVLAKLLVDMGHLQSRVPQLFQAAFNTPSQKSACAGLRIEWSELIKIFVALAAFYRGYRWARSSFIGSPAWVYNKFRRIPEAQKV